MKTDVKLFGEYIWGMAKKDVLLATQTGPCADNPGNSLILCGLAPVHFLGKSWQLRLIFNNEDELQQVILGHASCATWQGVQEALINAGWQPVFLETDGAVFDVFEQGGQNDPLHTASLLKEFETQALTGQGNIGITFMPAEVLEKDGEAVATYMQAIDKAGEDIVVRSLRVGEANMSIAFTAPILSRKNALRYGQMIKRG